MSVHYKFKNTINYDAVKFDGVYISGADLKATIVQQKRLGNSELQVENEETGQLYTDDQMIPKNTNIVVSRLPFANANKRSRLQASQPYPARFSASSAGVSTSGALSSGSGGAASSSSTGPIAGNHHHRHHHSNHRHQQQQPAAGTRPSGLTTSSNASTSLASNTLSAAANSAANSDPTSTAHSREAMELVSTKTMSEEEKIKYIQSQSTKDFDPARYARSSRGPGGRHHHNHHNNNNHHHNTANGGSNNHRSGFVLGPGYTCRKCGIPGHSIYDCKSGAMHKFKRSSGIPRDFLVKVDSKEKGALLTPSGEYVVPYIDREAYNNPKVEKAPFFEDY